MKVDSDYFYKEMPDVHFGVDIFLKSDLRTGMVLRKHWHEHLQLYVILSGVRKTSAFQRDFRNGQVAFFEVIRRFFQPKLIREIFCLAQIHLAAEKERQIHPDDVELQIVRKAFQIM
jgi:hypothetical protein